MLLSLVYVSKATAPMSASGLISLRDESGERNITSQITGLLLHRDGTFLQDLEGPEENVLDLYARIRRDGRNKDVTLVWTEPEVSRRFPRWSMALLAPGAEMALPGGDPADPGIPEATFVNELLDLFGAHT